MTLLAALCGDERLLDAWRREGFEGTVHSAFDRVVNLADASGALVSLAVRSLDDAPGTLRVDTASFAPCALRVGMMARTRGATFCIDACGLAVGLEGATAWRAWLPGYPSDDTRLRANLVTVQARLEGERPPLLAAPAQAIADALQQGDRAAFRTHARALLGLGPGLTPSGDDFLVGLFAALDLAKGRLRRWREPCDEIVAEAPSRTHAISVAALREAARGRVRDSIATLLRELVGGEPDALAPALARVLAIGATSGRDIVAGLLCALTASVHVGAEATP